MSARDKSIIVRLLNFSNTLANEHADLIDEAVDLILVLKAFTIHASRMIPSEAAAVHACAELQSLRVIWLCALASLGITEQSATNDVALHATAARILAKAPRATLVPREACLAMGDADDDRHANEKKGALP